MKKKTTYPQPSSKPMELHEAFSPAKPVEEPMMRTQIYLSRSEYDFVQGEASRRGVPMAAVIRRFIDDSMSIPDNVWSNNPLLAPPVKDSAWEGREDGSLNHDHYVYGSPKKWMKRNGQWVETPPVPEDYYRNPEVRRKYDEEVDQWT